ncbi:hypothetical protein CU041_12820 [Thalassospira povalilytica]|uniref:Uncharacterized protein n=1 Tax=Thalassospira povalilytica TaxID=732237 RepID=A0ABX4R787_9PROT|nr:hypothetical protein CU041_12820 [Thalassospira povalilytica]
MAGKDDQRPGGKGRAAKAGRRHEGACRDMPEREDAVKAVMPVVVPWPDDGRLKIVGSGTGQQVSRGPEQRKRGGCIGRNI